MQRPAPSDAGLHGDVIIFPNYGNDNKLRLMRLRHLIIALLLPVMAHAQYPGAYLEINSETGVYAVGDSIKVWATVMPECEPNRFLRQLAVGLRTQGQGT